MIWTGSLLPLLRLASGEIVQPTVHPTASVITATHATLALELKDFGTGRLEIAIGTTSVRFERLEITWTVTSGPALWALYFGSSILTAAQRTGAPDLDQPFWPDWRAEGFCVASAKTSPIQSFFRSWDFGRADITLGSFGPAMGAPYAAAFPRPLYAACLGGRHGWICLGAGQIPDAALTLQVRARSGTLEWLYREDLWTPPSGAVRTWDQPLWITWSDSAWSAYRDYFRLFPPATPRNASHQKSFWGTWGDFRQNRFDLRQAIDRAVDEMEADVICVDDPWESGKGSAVPDSEKFPHFAADIAHAHARKVGVGLWLPMGWIADWRAAGLSEGDLLIGRDGVPVRSNWAVDPRDESPGSYCLDPSTAGTRDFLRQRTQRVVREHRPTLLKIDFGYGLPGPAACAPREPSLRGERLAWTYARLIAEAAREIDPTITLLYYSLHPLWAAVQDQCSLDDLGDAGNEEAAGHGQWSIWAALAGERGMALLASSGYHWAADSDNLMNSAVIGAPGANLPSLLADGSPLPPVSLARRRALFRWHRRGTRWTPLWLDSTAGSLEQEPTVRNWGRLEWIRHQSTPVLTALALREPTPVALACRDLRGLRWTGRWIVLAQGDGSLFETNEVALIPLEPGTITLHRIRKSTTAKLVYADHTLPCSDWSWREGTLQLEINAAVVDSPLLGVLVSD